MIKLSKDFKHFCHLSTLHFKTRFDVLFSSDLLHSVSIGFGPGPGLVPDILSITQT